MISKYNLDKIKSEYPTTKMVYFFIETYSFINITVAELATYVGIHRSQAQVAISRLRDLGLIEVVKFSRFNYIYPLNYFENTHHQLNYIEFQQFKQQIEEELKK